MKKLTLIFLSLVSFGQVASAQKHPFTGCDDPVVQWVELQSLDQFDTPNPVSGISSVVWEQGIEQRRLKVYFPSGGHLVIRRDKHMDIVRYTRYGLSLTTEQLIPLLGSLATWLDANHPGYSWKQSTHDPYSVCSVVDQPAYNPQDHDLAYWLHFYGHGLIPQTSMTIKPTVDGVRDVRYVADGKTKTLTVTLDKGSITLVNVARGVEYSTQDIANPETNIVLRELGSWMLANLPPYHVAGTFIQMRPAKTTK